MERSGTITMGGNAMTLVGPELKVGDKAPDFVLCDQSLAPVSLADLKGKVKVFSVTPSLDTGVCDQQAQWFNAEAAKLSDDVAIVNVSMDLPFAIKRFCAARSIDKVQVLSDHRCASFGENWGVLIKELRLLCRAVFVVDKDDVIRYVEIVPEVTHSPDYDGLMAALKEVV